MNRHCTHCNSANVRRSHRTQTEAELKAYRSPYRCNDCNARFWVVSKKTYIGTVIGGILLVTMVALAISLIEGPDDVPVFRAVDNQPGNALPAIPRQLRPNALPLEDIAAAKAESRRLRNALRSGLESAEIPST